MSSAVSIAPADGRERALVFGTLFGGLAIAFLLGLGYARAATLEIVGAASVALMGVGKLLPLWGTSGHSQLAPWELGLLIGLLDTMVAVIVVYGSDGLCRIRLLARMLARVRNDTQRLLARRAGLERFAVASVMAFVLLPLPCTGAVSGAFLGILLGLRRRVVIAAVSAGGFGGGMLMALVAHAGGSLMAWAS